MTKYVAGALLITLVLYGGVKAWPLLRGPFISLAVPTDYTSSADGFVTVSGVAHNTEALFLNDGPLLIDPEGRFLTTLLLPKGGAILTLTATDRFGRQTTERRTVYIP
jgi:hypothetical protein